MRASSVLRKSWDIESTKFYIAAPVKGGDRLLLGPFDEEGDAEACLPRIKELLPHLPDLPTPELAESVFVGCSARWLHQQGELNDLFPRGLVDPHRRQADTVQYWRSPRDPATVRWVAYEEDEPSFVVGRGQFPFAGSNEDLAVEVSRRVARQDPLLARSLKTVRDDLPPREAAAGDPHNTRELRAHMLDVGMIVEDPADGAMKPITYWHRYRPEDEPHFTVRLSFDRQNPLENWTDFEDHRIFDVLDVFGFDIDMDRGYEQAPDRFAEATPRARAKTSNTRVQVSGDQGALFGGLL